MKKKSYSRANITVNKEEWEAFKQAAKENNSDASKEIRKMISRYIKSHKKKIS